MAEIEYPHRDVYQRVDRKWGWRLFAANKVIIAPDDGQGYENEQDARDMADRIIGGEFKDVKRYRSPRDK